MGKYTSRTRTKPKPPPTVHPVMRGIGCIFIFLIPILAYGVSVWLVNYAYSRGWPVPPLEWSGRPDIPKFLWSLKGLTPILGMLQNQMNLEANLVFTALITVVIGGVMAIVYGILFSIFGPPRYGPQDAPPIRGVKLKRYKR